MELQNTDGLNNQNSLRPYEWSSGWRVIQLEDRNTGRIEWLDYQGVHTELGIPYLINRDGFRAYDRGRERTVFMGEYGQPDTVWKAGARILPVQTYFDNGHRFETGDVVTLMPIRKSNQKPQQNIIRFVGKDSFGTGPEDSYDANDNWFTFVEPVTEARFNWEIIQGRGWSAPDMSVFWQNSRRVREYHFWRYNWYNTISGHNRDYNPDNNSPWRPMDMPDDPINGILPRLDLHNQEDSPARLYFGKRDPRHASSSDNEHPVHAVIDDFYVQRSDQSKRQLISIDSQPAINHVTRSQDEWTGDLSTSSQLLVDRSKLSRSDKDWPGRNDRRAFLIDGELVAYDTENDQILMHDGFGSAPDQGQHIRAIKRMPKKLTYSLEPVPGTGRMRQKYDPIAGQAGNTIVQGPTVLPLPLGPIQILSDGIPSGIEPVTLGNPYQHAPAHIALSEDGTTATVVSLVRSHRSSNGGPEPWTAPWLQGLYHTERVDPGTGVLIGMWPRYAPALPDRDSTSWTGMSVEDQQAALRSRMFPWISLVSDAYQGTFGRIRATGAPPPTDGGVYSRPDFFSTELRALAAGAQWRTTAGAYADGGTQINSHMVSLDNRYSRPQNGAEVRVHFRYLGGENNPVIQPEDPDLPYKAMFMGGMTPAIGSASLRFSSRAGILHNVAVE